MQGNEGADAGIEGIDNEELDGGTDNIIGPNGEDEKWKVEEEQS